MSILKGKTSLTRLLIECSPPVSSDPFWLKSLNGVPEGQELVSVGVMGCELNQEFSIENSAFGRFIFFSMVVSEKKIDKKLFEMMVSKRIEDFFEFSDLTKKEIAAIKEEVHEELYSKAPFSYTITNVIIDPVARYVYCGNTSTSMIDRLCLLFNQVFTFNLVEIDFMAKTALGDHIEAAIDDPGYNIVPIEVHPDFEASCTQRMGTAFLTYLLYRISANDGAEFPESEELFVENFIQLSSEALGSKTVKISSGILFCSELWESLRMGKQVSKMSVSLVLAEKEPVTYKFNIGSDFCISGITLPQIQDKTFTGRKLQRAIDIHHLYETIDRLFAEYLDVRYSDEWPAVEKNMEAWICASKK